MEVVAAKCKCLCTVDSGFSGGVKGFWRS